MKKRESLFKDRVRKALQLIPNIYFLKTQERGRRGVPDIIGCGNKFFFALELKTDDGELDKLQINRIEKIRQAGGFAIQTDPSTWEHDFVFLKEALWKK